MIQYATQTHYQIGKTSFSNVETAVKTRLHKKTILHAVNAGSDAINNTKMLKKPTSKPTKKDCHINPVNVHALMKHICGSYIADKSSVYIAAGIGLLLLLV